MLVLARKSTESIVIAHSGDFHELVRVTVVEISGSKVKLGFTAKNDLAIRREEVWERVCGEITKSRPASEIERPKYRVPYID
jgi:carbon storage regulator CsrA